MSLGHAGIVSRATRRSTIVEPDSLLMLVAYIAGLLLLYARTAGS